MPWRKAVENSKDVQQWTIHSPPQLTEMFSDSSAQTRFHPELNLTCEVRYHLTPKVHDFVDGILQNRTSTGLKELAAELATNKYPIYITRNLETAKQYARDRYAENADARFGLLASSRDRELPAFGIANQFQDSKFMKLGPWFSEGDGSSHSCRNLEKPATEFQSQGLELDFSIVCWGGDLIRENGAWTSRFAPKYKGGKVRDAFQLRINSYRVLLTRGRDGMAIFVPPITKLDETYAYLKGVGIVELAD